MVRVFTNGPGDRGSIPGQVMPKTQKMVLDVSLLNTHHYKVQIKSKLGQSWERSSALSCTLVAIEKGDFESPLTTVTNFTNKNMKAIVHSSDGDTDFFDIVISCRNYNRFRLHR